VQYPDIVFWLHYLDEHLDRNDGIQFSQYPEMLKEHGFICVSQLSADFVTPRDLADWLGIAVGTAVSLIQCAKKDFIAIQPGKLVIQY
jgi:hypothetical protein